MQAFVWTFGALALILLVFWVFWTLAASAGIKESSLDDAADRTISAMQRTKGSGG